MHLDLNLGFTIAALLQCIIIIGVVYHFSKSKPTAKAFFLAWLAVLTFQIILKGLSKVWVIDQLGALSTLAYELPFLYGPMAFLYIKSTIGNIFLKKEFLHFIPFCFFTALLVLLSLDPASTTALTLLPNTLPKRIAHALLMSSSLIFYFIYSAGYIRQYQGKAIAVSSDYEKVKLPWLKQFNRANLAVGLLIIVALELMYNYFPRYTGIRYFFLALTCLVYWLTFRMIRSPAILDLAWIDHPDPSLRPAIVVDIKKGKTDPARENKSKYLKSALKEHEAIAIFQKLKDYMQKTSAYLDGDLTLDKIATATGVSKHHISQVLNDKIKKTYFDFVNEYRVSFAKKLLTDPAYDNLTVAGIARECGFNSASGFNTVFKKMTGDTPSRFKKNREQNPGTNRTANEVIPRDAVAS